MRWMIGIVACMLGICLETANAQRWPITIGGTVRTAGGSAIPGTVRVRLESPGAPSQEQLASNGRFEFAGVAPGWYTVAVRAPQFEDVALPVLAPSEGEIIVTLHPKPIVAASSARAVSVFEYQIPKAARQQFGGAQKAARKNDCDGAIKRLKQAIEIFGEYAEAHNEMGNCYVKTGATALAEESFKKALRFTPAVYPALNLADLYASEGRFNEADDVLTNAIHRSPAEGNGYYALAVLRFRQDRLEEAEQFARQAHSYRLHAADVHLLLAKVYQRGANEESVLRELELYVKEAKPGEVRSRARQLAAGLRRQLRRDVRVEHHDKADYQRQENAVLQRESK